jgi:uncharacterized integral membrane protein
MDLSALSSEGRQVIMQRSGLPKLVFFLLAAYAAIHFSSYCQQLPEVVASHFNGRGAANGWQTKSAFFTALVGVSALAAVVGFGIPSIIAALPPQYINLPNKGYWLAPERAAETMEFLTSHFAWFGCALFLLIILTFDYAVQFNLRPGNPPAPTRLFFALGGFLLFAMVSTARIFKRFGRPPQAPSEGM